MKWIPTIAVALLAVIHPYVFYGATSIGSEEHRSFTKHVYRVESDKGFNIRTTTRGSTGAEDGKIFIGYTELLPVSIEKAEYRSDNGKWSRLRSSDISSTSIPTRSFYTGSKAMVLDLPPGSEYHLEYTTRCADMMFLTALPIYTGVETDTLIYKIQVPTAHRCYFQIPPRLPYTRSITSQGIEYSINVIKGIDQNEELFMYRPPFIRVLVTNGDHVSDPVSFFNQWYQQLVPDQEELSPEAIDWVNEQVAGAVTSRQKVKVIFQAVQDQIGYIDLEDGYNAFKPRTADQTLFSRKGDCKDMSNLMKQSLKYLGIEASLAISSTLAHPVDMDFPTLSSGNHVICVVELDGENFFLDATEQVCRFGDPSMQIQGRRVMRSDISSAEFISVPQLGVERNRDSATYSLQIEDNGSSHGSYNRTMMGMSAIPIRSLAITRSEERTEEILGAKLATLTPGLVYSEVNWEDPDIVDQLKLSATIIGAIGLRKLGKKRIMDMGLVERPFSHDLVSEEEIRVVTYQAVKKTVEVGLSFNHNIQLHTPIDTTFSKEGISFHWYVDQKDVDQLIIFYEYINPFVEMTGKELSAMREVAELVNQVQQQKIVYEVLEQTDR